MFKSVLIYFFVASVVFKGTKESGFFLQFCFQLSSQVTEAYDFSVMWTRVNNHGKNMFQQWPLYLYTNRSWKTQLIHLVCSFQIWLLQSLSLNL